MRLLALLLLTAGLAALSSLLASALPCFRIALTLVAVAWIALGDVVARHVAASFKALREKFPMSASRLRPAPAQLYRFSRVSAVGRS
jgi:hypothetical protein